MYVRVCYLYCIGVIIVFVIIYYQILSSVYMLLFFLAPEHTKKKGSPRRSPVPMQRLQILFSCEPPHKRLDTKIFDREVYLGALWLSSDRGVGPSGF